MVPEVSIVVPFLDEHPALDTLHEEIRASMESTKRSFEIILVDDGSSDGSWETASTLADGFSNTVALRLRRNFGKAAALDCGFRRAQGKVIVTLDADLQDLPSEIPRLLEQLNDGWDLVSGWKIDRQDPWTKRIPSKIFNAIIRRATGVQLHDFNCGLKAFSAEAIHGVTLYGELHRFIPVLVHARGFRVTEIPVCHRPRPYGRSKYGARRLIKGALDFATVMLTTRFHGRPLHMIGGAGLAVSITGAGILLYLTALWIGGVRPIGTRPLFFLGILLLVVGIQLLGTGLVAELVTRSELTQRPAYEIWEIRGRRT